MPHFQKIRNYENLKNGVIVIAHRLSTIRNADKIIGLHSGRVVEQGTHEELMKITNGVYFNLCNTQTFGKDSNTTTEREICRKEGLKEIFTEGKTEAPAETSDDYKASFPQILTLNAKEYPLLIFGAIISMASGALQPIWALIFADVLGLYGTYNCAVNKLGFMRSAPNVRKPCN